MNHRREPGKSREPDKSRAPGKNREPGEGKSRAPSTSGRASEQVRQAGDRAFGRPPAGPQWPGREPSDAERSGVPATDTEARTPLGVGTSTSRRAERIAVTEPEAGRRFKGLRGRSRRPYGTSEAVFESRS